MELFQKTTVFFGMPSHFFLCFGFRATVERKIAVTSLHPLATVPEPIPFASLQPLERLEGFPPGKPPTRTNDDDDDEAAKPR